MKRFWQRASREREIERELRAHLELEAEEQREAGSTPEEAGYGARRTLGNATLIKESVREIWAWSWLETLRQDLRYAVRSLRASPVFALVAILSLGFGIGANTAIFSFVNALLLKHLPVPEPTRLVQVAEYKNGQRLNSVFSFTFIAALNNDNQVFDGVAGRFPVRVNVTAEGFSEPLSGEVVTGDYFRMLRVTPALGRLLTEDDVNAGSANPVCVISYSTWQERFGGDPTIIGRKLPLNAHPYTVIGVTEEGFYGSLLQSRVEIQLPVSRMSDFMGGFFASGPGGAMWKSATFNWLAPLARLRPGVTIMQAQTAIQPIARASRARSEKANFRLSDGSQGANFGSQYSKPLTILMGIAALVLLITCANVAGLLLARASFRAKEFAVRLSLGASRLRLVRQLMVESLSIACSGGLAGLLLAYWIIHILLAYLNAGRPGNNAMQAAPDLLVIRFSISLSLLTAILFGLLPSWQSARPDIIPELKGSAANGSSTGFAMRKTLIVFQIALSVVILFAAGLLTRTLSKLQTVDLGFNPARVITLSVDPAMNGHRRDEAERVFDDILTRLRAQPGISAASLAVLTPLSGARISLDPPQVPGHLKSNSDPETMNNMISPDYFRTLNQSLLAGRDFDARDSKSAPKVAIVNQFFVRQYMPGQNPVGWHIEAGSDIEIVGVVKDARYQSLREKPGPMLYLPAKQTMNSSYQLLVRTTLERHQAFAAIRQSIHSVDPKLPIFGIAELRDQIDQTISSERVLSFLSTLFSGLTTLLCGLGIYGLIAYAVSRRTREIGIRLAIGAQKADVARLFLHEGIFLIVLGIGAGIPLAIVFTRALKSQLFGVAPFDAETLNSTVVIFLTAGLLAALLPAWKAARIEPVEALRYE